MLSNSWSKWTSSSNNSNHKTGKYSLSKWPSQRGHKYSSDAEAFNDSTEAANPPHLLSHGFGEWSNSATARGPVDNYEERPFVKMGDPEAIYQGTSFTIASETQKPK